MDINGVYASLAFPSMVFSFAGQRFMRMRDPKLGQLCVQAYNDWVIDEWVAAYPDRLIPNQLTWLSDAELAAAEIRRNAERGLPRGLVQREPREARLAVPAHRLLGSVPGGLRGDDNRAQPARRLVVPGDAPRPATPRSTRSPPSSRSTRCSPPSTGSTPGSPLRFPNIKIALSEGGIGWVPMILDRLDFLLRPAPDVDVDRVAVTVGRPAAQLLVRHPVGPVDLRSARSGSASTTSCSRSTIPTSTARGPTPRIWWTSICTACPTTTSARSPV